MRLSLSVSVRSKERIGSEGSVVGSNVAGVHVGSVTNLADLNLGPEPWTGLGQ